jgi:hypothetical protein
VTGEQNIEFRRAQCNRPSQAQRMPQKAPSASLMKTASTSPPAPDGSEKILGCISPLQAARLATVYEEPNPSRWAVPDLADGHLLYHLKDGQHHLVESIGRGNPTRLASSSVRCKHNRPAGPRHRRLQALPAGWTWRTAALGQGGEARQRRRLGPVHERVVVVSYRL